MRVSLVLLTRNDRADWFHTALNACLVQVGVELDLIVSTVKDDPSIPSTQKCGARLVVDQDPEPPCAHQAFRQLNAGLAVARGDYMTITSGNDCLLPTKCLDEATLCTRGQGVCYSAFYAANENLVVYRTEVSWPYDYKRHLQGNFVTDDSMMHRRVWEKYGPYRLQWGNFCSYDLWLRVGEAEPHCFVYNPKPEWIYRYDGTSRHVSKKKDPQLLAVDAKDRAAMLASHRR